MQQWAVYLFTATSIYMFWVLSHPSSRVHKTVTSVSGTGHTVGVANFSVLLLIIVQRDATMSSLFIYYKVTLHVSGAVASIIRST